MTLRNDLVSNPGGLEMFTYAPPGLGRGAPLVVVLHGCGQTAEGYAAGAGWLSLADRHGFRVLAPQQVSANNPNRCFNWFSPGDVARGGGEAASIAAMIALMIRSDGVDPGRVFITGLSAGGAMTLAMLASYPELFAAGAVIAGLPYGVARDMIQAMTVMSRGDHHDSADLARLIPRSKPGRYPRLTVWHGSADPVVAPANGEAIARQWALAHGLRADPDGAERDGGRTKSVWKDRAGGEIMVELNQLRGLGHGVPLSTRGPDGVGTTAPFLLEAGVSSSEEILEFWGLASATPKRPPVRPDPKPAQTARPELRRDTLGGEVLATLKDRVPSKVRDVIAKALKSAGLGD